MPTGAARILAWWPYKATTPGQGKDETRGEAMIQRYNRLSFVFGIPGIVLQMGGVAFETERLPYLRGAAALAGTLLLIVGLALYAQAKGRHPAWGVFGLAGILGLLVLACLKDRTKQPTESQAAAEQDADQASITPRSRSNAHAKSGPSNTE